MGNNSETETWGKDDVVMGLCFSILSLVELVFYIPCMVVMRTDLELKLHSCFQMMFHLGIADMVNLVGQLTTGICVATGSIFKIPLWLNRSFAGTMVSFSWYPYLLMCNIIAFNRFVTICLPPKYPMMLFSKTATMVWMSICWLYAGLWFVIYIFIPRGNFAYDTGYYTFYIDDEIVKRLDRWQNNINLAMMALWYTVIVIYLRTRRRAMTSEQKRMQQKERRIMVQACLICLYTLAFDEYWHWVADWLYADVGFKYSYGLGNLLWISTSGVNPLIYLTLNKTVKKKVKRLVNKNRVEPISLKQRKPNQPRLDVQETREID